MGLTMPSSRPSVGYPEGGSVSENTATLRNLTHPASQWGRYRPNKQEPQMLHLNFSGLGYMLHGLQGEEGRVGKAVIICG